MSKIRELQAADRRRQTVISELLRIDHRRSTETSELRTALQGQVTALQGQVTALQAQVTTLQGHQGLVGDPTQPELPEETGGRNIENKILVPKPPKNCARCAKCGYLVDGPNCQGCALLRQELEKILVTHSPDFQNISEPSNASTNVINAPREPYVVKQDNGSFVDKISFDLNRAPDSPNKFHCFHCKDVLRDGEACKRCTCAKCGSGLGKGHCYTCGHNQNSLNDSPSIFKPLHKVLRISTIVAMSVVMR
nr:hypothetical protein [Tanacetum cinerariifolium]